MTMMIGVAAGSGLALLLADAALSDMRGFRIPNRDPLLAGILFLAMCGFVMEPDEILLHVAAGTLTFVAGTALFALGVWGGGDVKLVAVVALWTGFAGLPRFLVVMALAGGALALGVLALRSLQNFATIPASPWRERLARSGDVPYGVAIAVAGMDWIVTTLPH